MKRTFLAAILGCLTLQAWPQTATDSTPAWDCWPEARPEAKPGTRWWWMGSAVNSSDLSWQMQQLAAAGIGSVEITPIYGVQGNDRNELPFLSPEWVGMLRFTADEGRRDGLLIDMNTGTGWPFGGPEVPIDEAACKAVVLIDTVAAGAAPTSELDKRELPYATLVCERRYPLGDDGREQVVRLYQSRTRQQVKRAAPGGEGYVIDHFDRDAVRHYLERFDRTLFAQAENGGIRIHNFFNDSYEVYGADWTPTLPEEFARRRGYRLEDHLRELIGLADDGKQALCDYRETLAELLLENFTEQWTAWAHSHGAQTRNQAHGSPANLIDVYAAVDVPEIEGFGLSEFGISGLRRDSGFTRRNDSDVSMLKYASSAAHITGKPLTSSETFTWLTEHFRTSLSQMKPDLDLMFTCGVNHMFFHGTTFSPQHDAWPGWKFYASVDMSPTNSIWRDAPYLMKYIERCQSFLQWGQPDNDFLVYLPVRNMWREIGRRSSEDDLWPAGTAMKYAKHELLMQFDIHSMAKKAPDFIETILAIDREGFDCDYISDRYLLGTEWRDGRLVTAAGTAYKGLIVPEGAILTPALKAHLDHLRAQGAPVIDGVNGAEMNRAARPEAMRKELGLRAIRRRNAAGHHYFIANLTPNDVSAMVPLAVSCGEALLFDPLTGRVQPAECEDGRVKIALRSGQSVILKTLASASLRREMGSRSQDVEASSKTGASVLQARQTDGKSRKAEHAAVIPIGQGRDSTPWTLTFIESSPEVDASFVLDSLSGWERLADGDSLGVLMGTGVYTTTVRLSKAQARERWTIDLGDVRESARVYINNVFVGCAWAVPFVLDCGDALHRGRNEIRIEVTNLPANRIADMDRRGVEWRKFKEINIVDLNYKKTNYAGWQAVKSGLCSPVRLVKR